MKLLRKKKIRRVRAAVVCAVMLAPAFVGGF